MNITKTFTIGLILLFTLNFVSCKKKGCTDSAATNYDSDAKKDDGSCVYPDPTPSVPVININSTTQYSFDLDGVNFTPPSDGSIANSYSIDKEVGETNTYASWSSSFYDFVNEFDLIGITKGVKQYETGTLTGTEFANYFAPGTYPFASSTSENGIIINYGEISGNNYYSNLGDQTGSSFSIIATKNEYFASELHVKVYAEFNCKVYNSTNPSEFKTITNAKFVGHFHD